MTEDEAEGWLSRSIQENLEKMLQDEPEGLRYNAEGLQRVRNSILETISEAGNLPVSLLDGTRFTLTISEKDARRFYGRLNAIHKGSRRRNRRYRSEMRRLACRSRA